MKQNQSSQSAAGVAFFRACEAQKPEAERICYDPYARAFVSGFLLSLNKLVNLPDLYEQISPGSTSFIFVRERYIDDVLKASLKDGLDQVVILGAGFDTRAYRIAGIEKTHVFEIDFPATQETKLKSVEKADRSSAQPMSPSCRWISIPRRLKSACSPAATTNTPKPCSSGRA